MPKPRARANSKDIPAWAEALRSRRVQLGLSQEDVMLRTNEAVSQRAISALETGSTPLAGMAIGRVAALTRALDWTLAEMQRATGVDLGVTGLELVAQGSADVYQLSAAMNLDSPGAPVDHEAVAVGIRKPLLLRADTEEMLGTSAASIRPGSTLHIDQSEKKLEEGRVYVITDIEGVHLRLYTITRLGAVFRAENRNYEDIPASEVNIIGRVVSVASDYDPNLN